jgi:hypothetical protein
MSAKQSQTAGWDLNQGHPDAAQAPPNERQNALRVVMELLYATSDAFLQSLFVSTALPDL